MGLKGYKGFDKGLVCRGKQYAENTVFEEEEAVVCDTGMHFCENPFDVLDYYEFVNDEGTFNDFAKVDALAETKTDDGKKFCTTKLKIGAKLSFSSFIKACVDFVIEKTKNTEEYVTNNDNGKEYTQIGSANYFSTIGSSGYMAQIGSSGDFAEIGSSGRYAKIASSGYNVNIGSSGDFAEIGSSGRYAKIASSGYNVNIGSSGDFAEIGSSGKNAQIASSSNGANIGSSGSHARIASSGRHSKIGSSGKNAQIASSGKSAKIVSTGQHSVICCSGHNSMVKAKKGSWITLAEWEYSKENNVYVPKFVKTEFVDGVKIKEDVFYKLIDGLFVEV